MMMKLHQKILKKLLLVALLFTTVASWGQLLSENFNSLSGSHTSSGGSSSQFNGNTNFPTVTRAYQAGGTVRLASGSGSGSITSKALNTTGNILVTFDVKGWEGAAGSVTVSVDGLADQSVSFSAGASGWTSGFQSKSVTFNGVPNTAAALTITASSSNRCFIDNVIVQSAAAIGTVTPSSLTNFGNVAVNNFSGSQTFTVGAGSGISGNITATAPANFQVSLDNNTFSSSVSFANPSSGTRTVYVRFMPSSAGSKTGSVTLSATGASNKTVSVSGTGGISPVISSSLSASSVYGSAAAYTVTATGTATITYQADLSGLPSGASIAGNTISFDASLPAGTYEIPLTATNNFGSDNKTLIYTKSPKALALSGGVAENKAYDGTTAAVISTNPVLTGIVNGDDVSLSGTPDASFNSAGAGIAKPVSINSGYSLTGTSAANYSLSLPQQPSGLTADIAAKELTIEGIVINDKDFDSNTSAVISGTAALVGIIDGDDVMLDATGATAVFTTTGPAAAIPVTVSGYAITGIDSSNYTLIQPQGLTANIYDTGLENQTITFNALGAVTYGDAAFELTATASSGLTVSYTSSDETVATVTGNTVTIVGAGTTTITAIQEGDDMYNPAESVMQELVVNQKELTVNDAAVTDKTYDGTTGALVTGTLTGIIGDDDVTVSGTGTFASANAGMGIAVTTVYTLAGEDMDNYSLTQPVAVTGTINPAELTITGAAAENKEYDGTDSAVITGTLSGIIGDDEVTLNGDGTFASINAGENIAVTSVSTLSGTDASNYTLTQPTGLMADIAPKALTVTATAGDKEYDRSAEAIISNIELQGVIAGDDVTASGNGIFSDFNAGTDKTVTTALVLGGEEADNYTLTQTTLTATITPKTVTADITNATASDKVYDGTTAATVSGVTLDGVVEGDDMDVALNGLFAQANAGEDIEVGLSLTGDAAINYTLAPQAETLTADITKAPLTATAGTTTIIVTQPLPETFSISYDGFVNGETSATADGFVAPTAASPAAVQGQAGAYPVVLSGGIATNYEFTALTNGILIIEGEEVVTSEGEIWDNDITDSNPSNDNPYTSGQVVAGNITVSGIGRGSGINGATASNRYNANGWDSESFDAQDYFTFTLTPADGYKIDLTEVFFQMQRSSTGPVNFALRSSLDGFESDIFTETVESNVGGFNRSPDFISEDFQNIEGPVEVRLYAWGASSGTGTFSINGFTFSGAVIQLPPAPEVPVITNTPLTYSTQVGNTGSFAINAAGAPVITLNAAIDAVPGAAFDSETGMITFDGTTPEGTYNITLTAESYFGQDSEVLVYTVVPAPALSINPVTMEFEAIENQGASAEQQITEITGTNLSPASGNVTIAVTEGPFQMLLSPGAWTNSISFPYTGNAVSQVNPQIYVRFAAGQAAGEYDGVVTISGGGATATITLHAVVAVEPTITITNEPFGPFCASGTNNISVEYTTEGTFSGGYFSLQRSDATGVFPENNTDNIIGGFTNPLTGTIPSVAGNYKVRVIHNGTAITYGEPSESIVVNAIPALTAATQAAPVCSGENMQINLTGLLPNAAFTVEYTIGGGVPQQATAVVSDGTGAGSFEIAATEANNGQEITVTGLTRTDVTPSCTAAFSTSATLSVSPSPAVTAVSAAAACDGEEAVITLTGLIPNSTSSIEYTVDNGETLTAENIVADSSGNGSFAIAVTTDNNGDQLEITSVTRTDSGLSCIASVSGITATLDVNAKPTVSVSAESTALCLGTGTNITLELTGEQPWSVTYTDGTDSVTVNDITASPFVVPVTPGQTTTYTVTEVSDANCTVLPNAAEVTLTVNTNTWTGTESSDWNDAGNWSCGTVPTEDIPVTIAAAANNPEITSGTANAASLTVEDNAVLTVAANNNLIVTDFVNVAPTAVVVIESTATLVQVNDVANQGDITVYRNSSPLYHLDYTIWSSPTTGSQTLKAFSPQTLDERFYVYNTELSAYSNYTSASGIFGGNPDEVTFTPAKGYLIRMPDGLPAGETSVFEGEFHGTPNNGDVTIGLSTDGNRYNAVGNPYPSPINIWQLIDDNESSLDNGTLYFWRKTNNPAATTYATITKAAYVANDGADGGNTSGDYFTEGTENQWVINPGQGFFVKAAESASGLMFHNGMRRAVNNDQFFRQDNEGAEISRLWFNITNSGSGFGQTAVAYSNITTSGLDYGWDGRLLNDGEISIYTLAENTKLAIQARQKFVVEDVVPLGYKATVPGNLTISLDRFSGLFDEEEIQVFLIDSATGTTHNIKAGEYTFTTDAGSYDDRFEIVYTNTLGTSIPDAAKGIVVYQQDNSIFVNSSSEMLKNLAIYDTRGRMIYNMENINAGQTVVNDLIAEQQVLIIEIIMADGSKVSKKIIY